MVNYRPNFLPDYGSLQKLDSAHEQGFRAFLSSIGYDRRYHGLASDRLVELMNALSGPFTPDYDDPCIVAAYIVKYHLSHCVLAYWSFRILFKQIGVSHIGVPEALYICDIGAGTGAARVGLGLALSELPKIPSGLFRRY